MTAGPDEATLRQAVACAVRAPSVWTSQPWRWRESTRDGVDLFADRDRRQSATDPHGHDLLLSCGAALLPATPHSQKELVMSSTRRDPSENLEPFAIADVARASPDFRRVIWAGTHAQIVVMTVPIGREIGEEVHEGTDQILTFVSGTGEADLAGHTYPVRPGQQCAVPAGTRHNFRNTGSEPLVLHTVYAPPEHATGSHHRTREQADTAERTGQDEPPAS